MVLGGWDLEAFICFGGAFNFLARSRLQLENTLLIFGEIWRVRMILKVE